MAQTIDLASLKQYIGDIPQIVADSKRRTFQSSGQGTEIAELLRYSMSENKTSRFLEWAANNPNVSYQDYMKAAAQAGVVDNPRTLAYGEILKEGMLLRRQGDATKVYQDVMGKVQSGELVDEPAIDAALVRNPDAFNLYGTAARKGVSEYTQRGRTAGGALAQYEGLTSETSPLSTTAATTLGLMGGMGVQEAKAVPEAAREETKIGQENVRLNQAMQRLKLDKDQYMLSTKRFELEELQESRLTAEQLFEQMNNSGVALASMEENIQKMYGGWSELTKKAKNSVAHAEILASWETFKRVTTNNMKMAPHAAEWKREHPRATHEEAQEAGELIKTFDPRQYTGGRGTLPQPPEGYYGRVQQLSDVEQQRRTGASSGVGAMAGAEGGSKMKALNVQDITVIKQAKQAKAWLDDPANKQDPNYQNMLEKYMALKQQYPENLQ